MHKHIYALLEKVQNQSFFKWFFFNKRIANADKKKKILVLTMVMLSWNYFSKCDIES